MRCNLSILYAVVLCLLHVSDIYGAVKKRVALKNVTEKKKTPFGLVGPANAAFIEKKTVVPGYMKWEQLHNGIPVYGAQLTTKLNADDTISAVYGTIAETVNVDTNPTIQKAQAMHTLKSHWHHNRLPQNLFYDETASLLILPSDSGSDVLAWRVEYKYHGLEEGQSTSSTGTDSVRIIGHIDAHSGEVVQTWNAIQHDVIEAVVGNNKIGKSLVNIDVLKSGSNCEHRDRTRRILVADMNNRKRKTGRSYETTFTCENAANENWDGYSITGGYSPRNEAYDHAVKFYNLWMHMIGTSPHETNTSYLIFNTHVNRNYENAYFDGRQFYFGDRYQWFYPLTSLDVVCHEVGHAITQWHGGKMDYTGESGGMNEAYSDVLGETCDMHYNGKTNYLIGDDFTRDSNAGGKMRDMCNPEGGSLSSYTQYTSGIDVHYSSGIYNKAWCTLAKTTGWDYIKAFKVFTRANLLYWSQTETMHCGACDVQQAATDLGFSSADVDDAFGAVDVSCSRCANK